MSMIWIDGKKYLARHVVEWQIQAAGSQKKFNELREKFDAEQAERNEIGKYLLTRQGEFTGKPADRMQEISDRIVAEYKARKVA